MRQIDAEQYESLISRSGLKPKLLRELRPKLDLVTNWDEREFVTVTDRSGNKGVLLVESNGNVFVLPYELSRGVIDKATGRARPVICDLCYTQQPGTLAGRLSITMPGRATTSRSILCCADLQCSAHVRGKTSTSLRSKAQLRETISPEDRIARLRKKLDDLVISLGAEPL